MGWQGKSFHCACMRLWLKRLWMLMWENFHVRWRTGSIGCSQRLLGRLPIFLLLEILWPVLLYLIMVILRTGFPPTPITDSYYRPIALPSAGTLPFVQSIICDLDGDAQDSAPDLPQFPNATVNDLYALLDEFGSLNGTLDNFCSTVHSLAEQTACINSTLDRSSPQCQEDVVPLTCFLGDPEAFRLFLTSDLQFPPMVVGGILGANLTTPQVFSELSGSSRRKRQLPPVLLSPLLSTLFGNVESFTSITSEQLRTIACTGDGVLIQDFIVFANNLSTRDVADAVCALDSTQLQSLADQLQAQFFNSCDPVNAVGTLNVLSLQDIQELVRMYSDLSFGSLANFSSTSNDSLGLETSTRFFCGENVAEGDGVFQELIERILFGDMTLFQQGNFMAEGGNFSVPPDKVSIKILYAPRTPRTDSVIARAAKTFRSIQYFRDTAEDIANCSQFFLDNYPRGGVQAEQTLQILDLLTNNESLLSTYLPPATLEQLTSNPDGLAAVRPLLNESEPGNIWESVTAIRNTAQGVFQILDLFDWDVFYPVDSEDELVALAGDYERQQELNFTTVIGGVVFEGLEDNNTQLSNATIKIRLNFTTVMDSTLSTSVVWLPGPESTVLNRRYLLGMFVFIQDLVERGLAEEMVGHSIPTPGLYLQQMPYPCYNFDLFLTSMEVVLPLAMLLAWLFPVAMTTRAIVREKESRQKEFIKMVGVSDAQLRLSRLIVSGSVILTTVVLITIFLKAGNILPLTHWSIVFLYLCLYSFVMLSYSFLVSTMFNNANLAACMASLLYFLTFFFFTIIVVEQQEVPPAVLALCCLFAPLAFAVGVQYMVQWELQQVGLQWSNIALRPISVDPLPFLWVCLIMGLAAVLYFLATWYIEEVAPGRYGVAKPLYFPFMSSYWLGQRPKDDKGQAPEDHEMAAMATRTDQLPSSDGPVCEEDPAGLTLGIAVLKMAKSYQTSCHRKKVTAIKDLSINFFEGQITALLGHNGAGKTTTLSILAGLFEPTSGTARIYGNDIRTHMDLIRQELGICPQHNILFDELTVEEHLLFFGQVKGLSWQEAKKQIPEWLDKVNLLPHAHKLAKHLSGGMKRKLSILLAFVGGSRTIILDEPTAGVDPFARRQIWDFLLRQRKGRTIILSTHHMDEAEILGDRIAIISHGSLICCGSFEFLKNRFGRGHTLTLVTASQSSESSEGVEAITAFLEGFVKRVRLEEVRGQELHYLLPLSGARANVLTQLFQELETEKQRLGVVSYGLTACSMEEIFIELTEKDEASNDGSVPATSPTKPHSSLAVPHSPKDGTVLEEDPTNASEKATTFNKTSDRVTGCQLWLSQFVALTVKRFHYTQHRVAALFVQNVLPLLLILLALIIAYFLQTIPDPPPIELSPNHLFSVSQNNYLFVGGRRNQDTNRYIQTLFRPCGVGARILTDDPFSDCLDNNQYFTDNQRGETLACQFDYPDQQPAVCSCPGNTSEPVCNNPSQFLFENSTPRCYNGTGTGSRVQELFAPSTSSNPSDVISTYLLRTKNYYIRQRYGGVSFGHEREEVDPSLDAGTLTSPFLAVRSAAKVWYSLKGYHAMPTYLNVLNNAIMRANLPVGELPTRYGFRTLSHPLPTTDLAKQFYAITGRQSFLVNPLALMFSLGFLVAGFVLLLIEERSGNVKHLQMVCGMNKVVYWLANSTWDVLWYFGFAVLTLALFLAFQDPFFTTPDVLPVFVLLLLTYGLAVTPWMYILSFLFQSPATAYVVLFCFNFFLGFIILFIDIILLFANQEDINNFMLDGTLNYWLLLLPVPSYPLGRSMIYLSSDYPIIQTAASLFLTDPRDPLRDLAPYIGAQLVQCVLYTLILVLIESWPSIRRLSSCCFKCRGQVSLPAAYNADSAVCNERSKVAKDQNMDHILSMNQLSKVYGTEGLGQKRVVVNQLSLAIDSGECFGLLGVNGAGKTTTFKMLTGDIRPSAGDAAIAGHNISEARGPVQASIGYCPQVDALIDQLTGRQHLVLFASLRGIACSTIKGVVQSSLQKLGLTQYADRAVGTYSGGNRRKLSTAIALLANPPLVLLDEPTSGVDPRARHFLWSIVRGIVSSSEQSVVLTTHSMAECEALCSRVAIMVNGEFHCLGSPQQLKSTYGSGYRLKLRVIGQIEPVKEFVEQNFPAAVLKEEHYTTLVYQLPISESLLLHNVFKHMEHARETLDIQDYSVSQTTLDDVFVHFANEQSEEVGLIMQTATAQDNIYSAATRL